MALRKKRNRRRRISCVRERGVLLNSSNAARFHFTVGDIIADFMVHESWTTPEMCDKINRTSKLTRGDFHVIIINKEKEELHAYM